MKNERKDFKRDGEYEERNSRSPKQTGARNASKRRPNRNFDKDSKMKFDSNHPSWYIPDANLLRDVASIPFSYRLGSKVYLGTNDDIVNLDEVLIPGIVKCNYQPVYGTTRDPYSAINTAAYGVYTWLRQANSGSRNYDAPDLMLYLMAMDSIYSGIQWLIRAYAVVNNFSVDNRYTPRALIESMGLDYNELSRDRLLFLSRLNTLILKASTLCVPNTFPLYERHAFMCGNIYVDDSTPKAQYYYYSPNYLYTFHLSSPTSENPGVGSLLPVAWNEKVGTSDGVDIRSWTNYVDKLDNSLQLLIEDQDFNLISGDILKAYGADKLFKLATVPADISLIPLHDYNVLTQMHNAIYVGEPQPTSLAIIQDITETAVGTTGFLKSRPYFEVDNIDTDEPVFGNDKAILLDFPAGMDTSPENVMVATRMIPGSGPFTVTQNDNTHKVVYGPNHAPSEIATSFQVFTMSYGVGNTPTMSVERYYYKNFPSPSENSGTINQLTWWQYQMSRVAKISHLNFAPGFYCGGANRIQNTTNFTTIDIDTIDRMNDMAMLGLFNVPRLTLAQSSNA